MTDLVFRQSRAAEAEIRKILCIKEEQTDIISRLTAFFLALLPLLQHYKGPVENAGFTVLLCLIPLLCIRFTFKIDRKKIIVLLPLVLFELYTVFIHGFSVSRMLYAGCIILVLFMFAAGCVSESLFFKYILGICELAVILLILQNMAYYLFHKNLELRALNLLVSQDNIWVRHAKQTTVGLFRRAAFFLEPSHFFLYCFPLLGILVLAPDMTKWRMSRAVFLSFGLVLTTSGFGVIAVTLFWGLYLIVYRREKEMTAGMFFQKVLSPRAVIIEIFLVICLVFAYLYIPVIHNTVSRFLTTEEGKNVAIDGRIKRALKYITTIEGSAVLIGRAGATSNLSFNLAGFFATYIKWGIIGVLLTYVYYVQGLFRLKREYFWLTAVIVVISFFTAHTHGTFYMLYFTQFLLMGYQICRVRMNGITRYDEQN